MIKRAVSVCMLFCAIQTANGSHITPKIQPDDVAARFALHSLLIGRQCKYKNRVYRFLADVRKHGFDNSVLSSKRFKADRKAWSTRLQSYLEATDKRGGYNTVPGCEDLASQYPRLYNNNFF